MSFNILTNNLKQSYFGLSRCFIWIYYDSNIKQQIFIIKIHFYVQLIQKWLEYIIAHDLIL